MGEIMQGVVLWIVIMLTCMGRLCMGDLQADQKECKDPLTSLATCFPYVQGTDKTPAKDCCTNLKAVRESTPKCLCILIKDSTTPALGFSINTTLALEMPSACKVSAKISDCPALLNISPSSPEAKIFGVANTSSPSSSTSGSGTGAVTGSPPSSMSSISQSKCVKLHQKLPFHAFLVILVAAIF